MTFEEEVMAKVRSRAAHVTREVRTARACVYTARMCAPTQIDEVTLTTGERRLIELFVSGTPSLEGRETGLKGCSGNRGKRLANEEGRSGGEMGAEWVEGMEESRQAVRERSIQLVEGCFGGLEEWMEGRENGMDRWK